MPPYSLGFIMKSLRISCQLFLYHTKDIIDKEVDSLRFYNLGDKYKNKVEHIGIKPSFDLTGTLIF